MTLLVVLASVTFLPYYLQYADKPLKSDVVVLFVGDDWEARQKQAVKLIADAYASSLIIPAYNTLSGLNTDGLLVPIDHNYLTGNSASLLKMQLQCPAYYEDTHFEVLEAQRIMTKLGFRSAIFVSSPYHMRRIKIITMAVFKEKSTHVRFLPAVIEKKDDNVLELICRHFKGVSKELIKIAWFETYSRFPSIRN